MENSVVPRNEMEANHPANPESGEGHNQPEETRAKPVISSSISFEERFRKLMDSLAPVKKEDKGHKPFIDKGHKPFIGQDPFLLGMKTKLEKYFRPRIMSIGPVYHGTKGLEEGQQLKSYLTKLFAEESSQSKEILYNKILKDIKNFKECYNQVLLKNFSGDDEELAWMFFVDGCALIQFVRRYLISKFRDMNIARDQIPLIVTDLMLLDNQLPLGVLNLVMGFSKEGGDLYQNDHPDGKQPKELRKSSKQSKELRKSTCQFIKIIEKRYFQRMRKSVKADSVTDQSFSKANHLLELFWINFVKEEIHGYPHKTKPTSAHFRSVKDLQAAGIRMEPKKSSSSLRDISFNHEILFWKLKIPSFLVSEQAKFFVFNLIAFEMLPNFNNDLLVTSYISFLNSLIATKEDVAELQKAGILINHLPNDQEVLETFRQITSCLRPYPDFFYDTKQKLIGYFNDKKSMTTGQWLREVKQVYFRNPWTIMAFISATFLLILTTVQTIFSVLSYQRRETICDFIPEEFNKNCSKLVTALLNVSLNLRKNG